MKIRFDTLNLMETLKSFYTLTGIRTVIFDLQYREFFSYPENHCSFCTTIRSKPELMEKCRKSDLDAFEKCKSMDNVYIYKCHAGLVEAVMPIKYYGSVIGYIMLGQITDIKDKSNLDTLLYEPAQKYGIECNASEIKYKSKKQIVSAAKILEICTNYMLLKETIGAENEKTVAGAKQYIENHLNEQISIYDLCAYLGVSRTRLYEAFKKECSTGIAAYIKQKRLDSARSLIKSSELSISEVSDAVGFSDYNYFSRVYKAKFGVSPHKDR